MKKLGKIISVFGYIDYLVSIAALGYGIYTKSALYIAAGLVGLVLAYLQPAEWVRKKLEAKIQGGRRRVHDAAADEEEAFIPVGVPSPLQTFLPRSRYASTAYFSGKGARKVRVANPRDMAGLVPSAGYREMFGVRPASVQRRQD